MLDLKTKGDILEQKYYDNIIPLFNNYEEFWKIFIGNDGNAKILFIDNSAITERRKLISQYSYTIFESLVCLFRIKQKEIIVQDIENYIELNNDFILFQTHCGRIRDCVHKIGVELKLKRLENKLEDFYKRRNNVLHGRKLPFTIIEEQFVLPIVEGAEFNPSLWKDELRWEDIHKTDIEYVDTVYEELFTQLIFSLNSIYSQAISAIKSEDSFSSIIEKMAKYESKDENYVTCSGIIDNHSLGNRFLSSLSGSEEF